MGRRHWKQRKKDAEVSQLLISNLDDEKLLRTQKFITNLLEFRKTKKLESTYIKGISKAIDFNEENRIYCSYNFDGTVTGRLSCGGQSAGNKKPMGVSFHTLPRSSEYNIRSVAVAPKDYVFLTVDYSAMELRVLSHVAKEKTMQVAFINKDDLHWYTTELIHEKHRSKLNDDQRQDAKRTSFLVVYGGTAATLANKLNISVEKAKEIMDAWMGVYPAVPAYMNFVDEFIKENHFAYSLFGRKRHLLNVTSADKTVVKKALRQGLNFTIQSVASDILLCALLGIDNEFKHRKLRSTICQTVHDSIELLIHKDEMDEAIHIINYYMIQNPIMTKRFGITLDVPLAIEILAGFSFGDGIEVHYDGTNITNRSEVMEYLKL